MSHHAVVIIHEHRIEEQRGDGFESKEILGTLYAVVSSTKDDVTEVP